MATYREETPAGGRREHGSRVVIDYAVESDAGAILGILGETFPNEILTRTPLGCTGARQYVADTISARNRGSDVVWIIARAPEVAGFVEMRRGPQDLFLNHIHVTPSRQGRGLGRRLLRRSIELVRSPQARRIGLSVFRDRVAQVEWYKRLSFGVEYSDIWVSIPLAHPGPAGWFCLGELAQADCMHARYGFSQIVLRTMRGGYKVGRLDDRFFRTADSSIRDDPAALGALAELGPHRQLVVTSVPNGAALPAERSHLHLATSMRMSADIDEVLARLRER